MLFKKLFRMLVLGGAVVGATSGCTPRAEAQSAAKGSPRDAGTPKDAGTGGQAGGGVQGW